jgi:putative aldouronate transport system permease protein
VGQANTGIKKSPKAGKKRDLWRDVVNYKYIYLLILPGMLFFIIFNYMPMYGIILAFKKFMYNKGITGSPWVGFNNFAVLFKNADFWRAVKNTLIISFGKIIYGFPVPIILALMLNELKSQKFKKSTQTVLYLPHFISWVIMAGLIYNMFSVTNGAVGKVMYSWFGIEPKRILGNPAYFRTLVYLSDIWKGAGWGTIIYLAAISGVNPELYESAVLDGANRLQQTIYITIPSLSFAISINLILAVGGVMNAGFDQIFNLYDPGVYQVGDIIDTYVYRLGIQNAQYEMSTAVGLFKSVINCALLVTANKVTNMLGQEGLF